MFEKLYVIMSLNNFIYILLNKLINHKLTKKTTDVRKRINN